MRKPKLSHVGRPCGKALKLFIGRDAWPAPICSCWPHSTSSHFQLQAPFLQPLERAWARTAQQNQSQVSDPQKPWDNKMIYFISCLFMLFLSRLHFLAFCCAAIATEMALPLVKKRLQVSFPLTHSRGKKPSLCWLWTKSFFWEITVIRGLSPSEIVSYENHLNMDCWWSIFFHHIAFQKVKLAWTQVEPKYERREHWRQYLSTWIQLCLHLELHKLICFGFCFSLSELSFCCF